MNKKDFDSLTVKDTYSLLMFALYTLKNDPKYSTLSELSYILDRENFLKMLEYYGGLTIKIPTVDELHVLLNALALYNYVDIQKKADFTKGIKLFEKEELDKDEIVAAYTHLQKVLSKYEFGGMKDDEQ